MNAISINKESLQAIMKQSNKSSKKAFTSDNSQHTRLKIGHAKAGNAGIKAYRFFKWLIPPVFGILLLIAIWALISYQTPNLPGPVKTWNSAVTLFSDPFYDNGPNDKGVGWNILASLQRVGLGFGLAALVGTF